MTAREERANWQSLALTPVVMVLASDLPVMVTVLGTLSVRVPVASKPVAELKTVTILGL